MDDSTVEKLLDALKPLADKLGEGAEQLFRLAVKDAIVTGVIHSFIAALFLAGSIVCLVWAKRVMRSIRAREQEYRDAVAEAKSHIYKSDYGTEDLMFMRWWILGGAVALLIPALVFAQNAAYYLINPEYQAVQSILESVRG